MADPFAFSIARAGVSDLPSLTSLRRAFHDTQVRMGLLDLPQDPEGHLDRSTVGLLESRRSDVLIARTVPGAAVAYATSTVRFVPDGRSKTVGLIEEVFVGADHRGAGLASALVDGLIQELRLRAVDRIQIRVLARNSAARALWERLGFEPNVLMLELPPADPGHQENIP